MDTVSSRLTDRTFFPPQQRARRACGTLGLVQLAVAFVFACAAGAADAQSYPNPLVNTVQVTLPGNTTDPVPNDNTATDSNTLAVAADLSITKTLLTASPVAAGGSVSYQLVVSNAGPSLAENATVTDNVPVELTNVSWTCSASSPASSCATATGVGNVNVLVTVAPGDTTTIVVTGTAPLSGTIGPNTATVTPPDGTTDPDPDDNTATTPPVDVTPVTDLSLVKTLTSNSPAAAGSPVSYQIVVSNAGPSDAIGAMISDAVPAELTNVTWTCTAAGTSTCGTTAGNGNQITLSANVAAGAGNEVTVTVTGTAPASGTIGANTATVTPPAGTTDPDPDDNTDTTPPVDVTAVSDLSVVKTLTSASPAPAGSAVTYQIVVSNDGPSDAIGAAITDTVPPQLADVSWTCVAAGTSSCGTANGTGDINLTANVGVGAANTVTLTVTGTAPASGTIGANTATVAPPAGTTDPDPSDDSSTTPPVPVSAVSDLSVVKTLTSASPAPAGSTVTYQIVVSNAGPSDAIGAALTDAVPAELTNVSWTCTVAGTSSCGTAAGNGNDINVTANVAAGAGNEVTITVTGTAPASGTIGANTATVTPPPGTTDPSPGDNTSITPPVDVTPVAGIAVQKTLLTGSPATEGSTVTYQVLVSNAGPSDVQGVTITDAVPAELTNVTWQCTATAGSSCSASGSGNNVSVLADIAAGGTVTLTISGAAPASGTIGANTAAATLPPGTQDPNPGDNSATVPPVPVLELPGAVDDAATTPEDTPIAIDVLANDDLGTQPTTITAFTQPANGTVACTGTGCIYTPAANFNGEDAFTYTITDANGNTSTATVTVTVQPVNDAPMAVDDAYTMAEDSGPTVLSPSVLANDSDVDGDTLTIIGNTQPANGAVTCTATDCTYAPNANFVGTDTFTYTVDDGNGGTATATVTITVTPANDAPIAGDDTATTPEDAPLTIPAATLLANDSDPDGDPLTISTTSGTTPSGGSFSCDASGCTYTPPANFTGTDSFEYQVCDAGGACDTATVTITVTPVNDAPVVADDAYTVMEDSGATVLTPSVLANDSDVDGDTLTITGNTQPANGAVTCTATDCTYTPNANFTGTDTFTYTVDDGNGGTATATVTITVTPANDAPMAGDDTATTPEDAPLTIPAATLLANDSDPDGDPLTISTTSGTTPSGGSFSCDASGCTYTPPANFTGTDSFEYQVCDAGGACDTATVTITVTPVNDAPVAMDDAYSVAEDSGATVLSPSVLANDSDVDGDTLTIIGNTQPANGAVTCTATDCTYAPNANFVGTDTFTYTVDDGNGGTATATVTITVTPANDAPVAGDDTATTQEDAPLTIPAATLLANDSDPDGDPLTISTTSGTTPSGGSFSCDASGCTYTPPANFTGTDSFEYQVCDAGGACDTATVTITVTPVNDAPVAMDDAYSVAEDSGATVLSPSVLANDSDVDGDTLTITGNTQPANGTVTCTATDCTYTPNANFTGTDTFTYTVSDGNGGTATATVTITVADVPEPIAANDDTAGPVNGKTGATAVINVLDNDTLGGAAVAPGAVVLAATNAGPVTINPDGTVDVAPNTPAGTYTASYQICEAAHPGNCDTATVTVTVGPAPIAAYDDNAGPLTTAGGSNVANVLDNDTLDGDICDPADVIVAASTSGPLTINGNGSIDVAPNTPAGTYTASYQVCEALNPTNCATATATVIVAAAVLAASDDAGTVASGAAGGTAVANVLANDTVDGAIATTATVTLTQLSSSHPNVVLETASGAVTVAAGTPAGTYTLSYQICEVVDPANCATATVTVTVGAAAIAANDDTAGPVSGSAGGINVINVLANDTLGGSPLVLADVVFTPTSTGPLTINPDGSVDVAPSTPAGTYTATYQICERLNPANCDTAVVTVTVNAAVIDAIDDVATVNGTTGGTAVINVLGNDTLGGSSVNPADVTLTSTPSGPLTITSGGMLDIAPNTPAGTYTITYRICQNLNPGNCDNATVTATVTGDPVALRLTKRAMQRQVKAGELVRYTVTAENVGAVNATAVTLVDTLPAGFTYVDGTLVVDDDDDAGSLAGTHPLTIAGLDLAPGRQATITYYLRAGAGVGPGIHTNRIVAQDAAGQGVSNMATADVEVAADPLFEDSLILGTVFDDRNGNGIQDAGERGVPGVRIASVEGLIVETDAFGRYHLTGIPAGALSRGRLFILKVDPSTLPAGTTFTTENPRVRRITPGLPVRFDFGVKLPEAVMEGGSRQVSIELGEVIFARNSAQIPASSGEMLDRIAATVREHRGGRITIVARGAAESLAFQRAQAVQGEIGRRLDAELAGNTRIDVTTEVEPLEPLVSLERAIGLSSLLFDTNKADVRPQYSDLIRRIAQAINERGRGELQVSGYADVRGNEKYNLELGLRRARAVYDAIAAELDPGVRERLRVDIQTPNGAVAGVGSR